LAVTAFLDRKHYRRRRPEAGWKFERRIQPRLS
jgi:hypothetical protein